ncbi:MAG: TrbG/VirB9 family P-type conjugative transfer protein [Alphaproteobacteria bacterium]
MVFVKLIKFNVSAICLLTCLSSMVYADSIGKQQAWDHPEANMASGSIKPGYAQLSWSKGSVLPIKLRNGMVTMIKLPNGEQISDAVVGDGGLFQIQVTQGDNVMYITPETSNQGSDTNMIVSGQSGNQYIFYLRSEPTNASEITYSQVDIVLDGNANLSGNNTPIARGSGMHSIFTKESNTQSNIGVDGEDYGWIKSMKIDPSEFRFDLDIFVPNPDDYIIAPERVWHDRVFTYIDFGDKVISMTQRPVVSLLVEGGESPVGFRTDGEDSRLLIVEAVGDMILRSGQRIVCIKKRAKPFLIADTASVMALAEANVAQSLMSSQSLNNIAYNADISAMNGMGADYSANPTYVSNANTQYGTGVYANNATINMLPTKRETAGAYLPQTNIPIISSNQTGVAVELKSGTSVKELDDYWLNMLAKFTTELSPYKDKVFYAIDEQGVGDLGSSATTARMYRLRIGPINDVDTAQTLCDKLLKFGGTNCNVVRVQ